jgi:hypothetical protein
MLVQRGHLNDLLTLPTGGQHGALLPVVNINRLLVKVFVVAPTKVANLFILIVIEWIFAPVVIIVVLGIVLLLLLVVVGV